VLLPRELKAATHPNSTCTRRHHRALVPMLLRSGSCHKTRTLNKKQGRILFFHSDFVFFFWGATIFSSPRKRREGGGTDTNGYAKDATRKYVIRDLPHYPVLESFGNRQGKKVRACLLGASLLYCAISCNGTQGHGGEEGTQKGKKNDEECLPHSSISHNVEEAQKDEHTCMHVQQPAYS